MLSQFLAHLPMVGGAFNRAYRASSLKLMRHRIDKSRNFSTVSCCRQSKKKIHRTDVPHVFIHSHTHTHME